MKVEPILRELEGVKEKLAAMSGGNTRRFLEQMEAWLDEHPHPKPVVNSPEDLQARVRRREETEPPLPAAEPYRVHDPIIAEIHRIREQLHRERMTDVVLKEEPRKYGRKKGPTNPYSAGRESDS